MKFTVCAPQEYKTGVRVVEVSPDLSFTVTGGDPVSDRLQSALDRYAQSIPSGMGCGAAMHDKVDRLRKKEGKVAVKRGAVAVLSTCTVSVENQNAPLGKATDESYALTVDEDGACALSAATTFGALRGLESLSALAGEACVVENAPVSVTDAPRFGYRGLMVDSSRHFLPVPTLERILDSMVSMKLNVLHWHISDSQSFPGGSLLYPKLSQEGAYLYPDAAYSVDDMAAVVSGRGDHLDSNMCF
jgi:hexosaminidase